MKTLKSHELKQISGGYTINFGDVNAMIRLSRFFGLISSD